MKFLGGCVVVGVGLGVALAALVVAELVLGDAEHNPYASISRRRD